MAPLTTSLIVFHWNQTMYIQLTYQIHLGDSPFFIYIGVNVLASPVMFERSWIHTHEVLSSAHKKKKKLNKRWVLEIQFEMEVTGIVLLSWPTGGKQILYLLFFIFIQLKVVKIELTTPQGHYIVTNQSPWLEGVIKLIVRNVEGINLNERWPCRKEKAI